eukprot:TRINITY_DN27270_c0_g1_i1.p1 TRINITY_DN27270_c0_g1~~TRINITY_DN27270_c0_g1_i1.p1  ORF type:complete len:200 (+),score=31.10 TRINITY_DN27270_c0_g1_i1:106-705(+)
MDEGCRGSLPTTGVYRVQPVACHQESEKVSPPRRGSLSVSPMREGLDEMEWAANALEALRRANEELSSTLEEATGAIGILRMQNEQERAVSTQLAAEVEGLRQELAKERASRSSTAELESLRAENAVLRQKLVEEQTLHQRHLEDLRNAEADITEARAKLALQPPPISLEEQLLLEAAESQLNAFSYLLENPTDFDMRD